MLQMGPTDRMQALRRGGPPMGGAPGAPGGMGPPGPPGPPAGPGMEGPPMGPGGPEGPPEGGGVLEHGKAMIESFTKQPSPQSAKALMAVVAIAQKVLEPFLKAQAGPGGPEGPPGPGGDMGPPREDLSHAGAQMF